MSTGDACTLTMPGEPNLTSGARGWDEVSCFVQEREPSISPDEGARISLKLRAYTQGLRLGRVSPSAYIATLAGTLPGVGHETLAIDDNRFTDPDNLAGFPTDDAAAFEVGDVVQLRNADMTLVSSNTETVISLFPLVLVNMVVSGNFGGALAAGLVIVHAGYDLCTQSQRDRFCYASDLGGGPGTLGSDPYIYGRA